MTAFHRLRSFFRSRDETVADLEQQLERERVKTKVQQMQIDELLLVVARNHERVKREITDLGGGSNAMKSGDARTIDA
jgi:hypothetical protein